jgi:hypothetical protein
MPDFLDDNDGSFNIELHAIISGTHAKSAAQRAPQRLGATDVRPSPQTLKDRKHAPMDRNRKSLDLPKCVRQNPDRHFNIIRT